MELVTVAPRSQQVTHDLSADQAVTDVTPADAGRSRLFVGADAYNPDAAAVAYLQVFEEPAADVTLGTTEPVAVFAIPPGARLAATGYPIPCSSGCSYAVTATRTGNGAPSTALSLSIWYA